MHFTGYVHSMTRKSLECLEDSARRKFVKSFEVSNNFKLTDEALIAETAVWPNFFLMNVFFALKGSKLFIIIYHG